MCKFFLARFLLFTRLLHVIVIFQRLYLVKNKFDDVIRRVLTMERISGRTHTAHYFAETTHTTQIIIGMKFYFLFHDAKGIIEILQAN